MVAGSITREPPLHLLRKKRRSWGARAGSKKKEEEQELGAGFPEDTVRPGVIFQTYMVTRCFSGGGGDVDKAMGGGKTMTIKYAHGIVMKSVSVSEDSTFAELKEAIARDSDVPVRYQRLLYRGREREDHERLRLAGVRSNAKVILDDTAYRHARVRRTNEQEEAEAQRVQLETYRNEQRRRQEAGAAASVGGAALPETETAPVRLMHRKWKIYLTMSTARSIKITRILKRKRQIYIWK